MSTYVRTDWVARNEYTTPIKEVPIYRNSGIIKAVTKENEKIQVGRITYEEFENEEFQYIISPFWPIIDTLSTRVFIWEFLGLIWIYVWIIITELIMCRYLLQRGRPEVPEKIYGNC